jgi:hypothetical protein
LIPCIKHALATPRPEHIMCGQRKVVAHLI